MLTGTVAHFYYLFILHFLSKILKFGFGIKYKRFKFVILSFQLKNYVWFKEFRTENFYQNFLFFFIISKQNEATPNKTDRRTAFIFRGVEMIISFSILFIVKKKTRETNNVS